MSKSKFNRLTMDQLMNVIFDIFDIIAVFPNMKTKNVNINKINVLNVKLVHFSYTVLKVTPRHHANLELFVMYYASMVGVYAFF